MKQFFKEALDFATKKAISEKQRQEIRDIDPNLKVWIMDEKIYDIHGTQLEVVDGKIKPVLVNGVYKVANKSETINIDYDNDFFGASNGNTPMINSDNVFDNVQFTTQTPNSFGGGGGLRNSPTPKINSDNDF